MAAAGCHPHAPAAKSDCSQIGMQRGGRKRCRVSLEVVRLSDQASQISSTTIEEVSTPSNEATHA
jgi:hypothetical protein